MPDALCSPPSGGPHAGCRSAPPAFAPPFTAVLGPPWPRLLFLGASKRGGNRAPPSWRGRTWHGHQNGHPGLSCGSSLRRASLPAVARVAGSLRLLCLLRPCGSAPSTARPGLAASRLARRPPSPSGSRGGPVVRVVGSGSRVGSALRAAHSSAPPSPAPLPPVANASRLPKLKPPNASRCGCGPSLTRGLRGSTLG